MSEYAIDTEKLGTLIQVKMGNKSLRDVESETGLSPSTISRISNHHIPRLDTFLVMCEWVGISPTEFIINANGNAIEKPESEFDGMNTIEKVEYLLRSDSILETKLITAIMNIVRVIIEFESGK